jgi:hypothetical protein
MKLYQKYYVAIKPNTELAYVIPLFGSEANILKQKSKGDYWAKEYDRESHSYKEGISIEIENTPTKGYEVIGFSSRYSTSNKHIYLKHPQGFHFEMAIETFVEMLKETTIENGIIQNEMVIYSYKGKNALCVYGGELYSTLEEVGVKFLKVDALKEGDIISLKGVSNLRSKVTYIGKRIISAAFNLSYNTRDLQDATKEGKWVYRYTKNSPDTTVTFNTKETEVYMFIREENGNKTPVTYVDPKKIKVISVLGNEPLSDKEVGESLDNMSAWSYAALTKDQSVLNERNNIASSFGSKGYACYYLVDIDLKSISVDK